ncbi:MAG: hydroxyacylglutathione hydrolase [Micavibrio sp.]|nr:MAG: hydroxyacylglutathione hydrolase [Micavibrio sp.]
MINVTIVPVLEDNYAYLLEADNGETAIVDPGESGPVIVALGDKDLNLDYILNTHHHSDHIAGNRDLKNAYNAKLAGPAKDSHRIADLDIELDESSVFEFGGEQAQIFETPGHTTGGICIYFPISKIIFTGDTIFSLGCGRLFEGTPEQMWASFQKIMALPDDTKLYCGHEYTQGGARFCLTVEPDNPDLKARAEEVNALREEEKPTLPSTIGIEKKTNVFLRAGSADRFAEIRKLRDNF